MEKARQEAVVFVHGLWMRGPDMTLLRRRVRLCGYRTYQFHYRSISADLCTHALELQQFLQGVEEPVIHFVAHSMGGLVVRRLFLDHREQRPGRIVTLGTPHQGSHVGRWFGRFGVGRLLLGRSAECFAGGLPDWHGERELGSIAGKLAVGVGWVARGLPSPNDGTVAVKETELPGLADHLVLSVSHMGMLVAPTVARQTCHFLCHGHFARPGNSASPQG